MSISAASLRAAGGVYRALRKIKPQTKEQLLNYVKVFLGVSVPDQVVCSGHSSPADYLWHAFNCDDDASVSNGDCVVWANRGGGKTMMAAVATLLDCLFKDAAQVRILAGSFDQASRMYEYLVKFVSDGFEDKLAEPIKKSGMSFVNGSKVEVLTQSAKSVRGCHIHKLRCDEVEMFDTEVFEAAQFITQSTDGKKAAMEIASTMHRPYGLMQDVVAGAKENSVPIFKWCLWEVIEKCTQQSCSRCPLNDDCRGRAKHADGYYRIDDAISQMRRSSRQSWQAEVLCERPLNDKLVFSDFERTVHVKPVEFDIRLPLYRTIDFGFVNPFVCLWIQVDGSGVVRVLREYQQSRMTILANTEKIISITPCDEACVAATFCDPAGNQHSDITGTNCVQEMRRAGVRVRSCKSGILEGIEKIRKALKDGFGNSRIVIDPKCTNLIKSLETYHYPDNSPSELPVKDGISDHHIDALRYFFVNYEKNTKVIQRRY
ncbi:MAG: hypothetical protein ACIAQZ_05190 [Sedimentisphaeraceae bacterium JB056]